MAPRSQGSALSLLVATCVAVVCASQGEGSHSNSGPQDEVLDRLERFQLTGLAPLRRNAETVHSSKKSSGSLVEQLREQYRSENMLSKEMHEMHGNSAPKPRVRVTAPVSSRASHASGAHDLRESADQGKEQSTAVLKAHIARMKATEAALAEERKAAEKMLSRGIKSGKSEELATARSMMSDVQRKTALSTLENLGYSCDRNASKAPVLERDLVMLQESAPVVPDDKFIRKQINDAFEKTDQISSTLEAWRTKLATMQDALKAGVERVKNTKFRAAERAKTVSQDAYEKVKDLSDTVTKMKQEYALARTVFSRQSIDDAQQFLDTSKANMDRAQKAMEKLKNKKQQLSQKRAALAGQLLKAQEELANEKENIVVAKMTQSAATAGDIYGAASQQKKEAEDTATVPGTSQKALAGAPNDTPQETEARMNSELTPTVDIVGSVAIDTSGSVDRVHQTPSDELGEEPAKEADKEAKKKIATDKAKAKEEKEVQAAEEASAEKEEAEKAAELEEVPKPVTQKEGAKAKENEEKTENIERIGVHKVNFLKTQVDDVAASIQDVEQERSKAVKEFNKAKGVVKDAEHEVQVARQERHSLFKHKMFKGIQHPVSKLNFPPAPPVIKMMEAKSAEEIEAKAEAEEAEIAETPDQADSPALKPEVGATQETEGTPEDEAVQMAKDEEVVDQQVKEKVEMKHVVAVLKKVAESGSSEMMKQAEAMLAQVDPSFIPSIAPAPEGFQKRKGEYAGKKINFAKCGGKEHGDEGGFGKINCQPKEGTCPDTAMGNGVFVLTSPQGVGFCAPWSNKATNSTTHQFMYTSGDKSDTALGSTFATKMVVAHPDTASLEVGVLAFKRTVCNGPECHEYKVARCFKCNTPMFQSIQASENDETHSANFVENCVQPLLKNNHGKIPDANQCVGSDLIKANRFLLGF